MGLGREVDVVGDDGFAAFGKPVPLERCTEALKHCRMMDPEISTADAMSVVSNMARQIEKDEPYEAIRLGMARFDLTGTYRLLAVLCTDPPTKGD